MPNNRLTDEDITNLVGRMLDLTSKHPTYSFTKTFTLAQDKVLPPHKRYRQSVLQQRSKWSMRLQGALKGAGLWPGYQPPVVEAPPPPPTPAPTPTPAPAPLEPEPVDESATILVKRVVDRIFQDLWQRANAEIDKQVRERLKEIFSHAEIAGAGDVIDESRKETIHIIEHTAMPVSIRRAFVIGLLPEQIVVLRRKLHDFKVELRFWKNEAQTKLADNAEWADDIFVMTKFVSHSTIHAVRNKGREKVKYCNGAVSDLERQIRYASQEVTA